jgi:hypothetical protein
MTRRLKIVAFAATIAGFTAMAGTYHVGFDLLPPQTMLADGRSVPLDAAGVQACFKARALALVSDRNAESYWHACRRRLMAYGALDAFELRSTGVNPAQYPKRKIVT